ncbi:hypothetical protein KV691_20595 [Xanthomonas euvesicatoria pv. alangii]|uniref:hypothetical protein n=1 Tax=Xanthomonas euvesicatoria TaxID=456327 RepID=UPI001C464323|nr:hypothetical protein [Xanthomonas euvesicatoria]MBV6671630.1 hypothetical protein [Xanthomonas euvesicatoria pv. alangii]
MTIIDARRAHRPLSGVLTLCRCAHVIVLAACAVWQIAALIVLATAAHQGGWRSFSTLLADLPACHAVATVAGLGTMVLAPLIGFVLQAIGSYISIFFYGGCGLHSGAGGGAPPGVTTQPARVEQPA